MGFVGRPDLFLLYSSMTYEMKRQLLGIEFEDTALNGTAVWFDSSDNLHLVGSKILVMIIILVLVHYVYMYIATYRVLHGHGLRGIVLKENSHDRVNSRREVILMLVYSNYSYCLCMSSTGVDSSYLL